MIARLTLLLLTMPTVVFWVGPASAGDDLTELTIFVGERFGGDFQSFSTGQKFDLKSAESYGVMVDVPTSDETKATFLYSFQDTDLETQGFLGATRLPVTVEYFHVGIVAQHEDGDVQPFYGGAVGATHFNPEGRSSDTRFSFSLFGGVKMFFGNQGRVGLRLEGRAYGTVADGNSAVFCGTGGCSFGFSGNVLWQGEVSAGLIVAF